ncbi:MAG: Preprotein translocase, SecE subunit [Candidatus Nomurabacteria bacterium GW2011_GWA1_46_11]|uniref:Protein translocase subunit SecE n=1 Tax=Candidatus Nomurabacteria bacterium GW2011_GWA1_46_11 TaxID=1618732 RepID=A0A0G1RN34_9BACT|nr:MAG: Preprotein translocase, SecE subunit [Microgenomates group bacterium GW2011_GWA2_44_7]KKT78277.1 MAG: Preprotein translocase, SecE subunit [Microgenomates group bacterium GW2011_GWB1_44_8]KKU22335.1 MAG: Preprotein translocase, SecE subunit [Candidatus Nomurabacteria bacterium GW2011_GWA1_46_11]
MPWTKAIQFLQSTKAEIERVHWPSKEKTARLTALVVILTLGVGLYIGLLDILLTQATASIFIR